MRRALRKLLDKARTLKGALKRVARAVRGRSGADHR